MSKCQFFINLQPHLHNSWSSRKKKQINKKQTKKQKNNQNKAKQTKKRKRKLGQFLDQIVFQENFPSSKTEGFFCLVCNVETWTSFNREEKTTFPQREKLHQSDTTSCKKQRNL